jgi:hypothetical protein
MWQAASAGVRLVNVHTPASWPTSRPSASNSESAKIRSSPRLGPGLAEVDLHVVERRVEPECPRRTGAGAGRGRGSQQADGDRRHGDQRQLGHDMNGVSLGQFGLGGSDASVLCWRASFSAGR